MTAVVEASAGRDWPAWQVPPAALGEWLQLQGALEELEDVPACADQPEAWFSRVPAEVEWARLCCAVCPVVVECRAYALAADERHGTWGGLSEVERRQLAGRRR